MTKYLPLLLVPVIPLLIAASTPSVSTPSTSTSKHVKLYNQGVKAQKQGDDQRAIRLYQKALKVKPDFADALNNLGYSLRNIAKQYMDEAMQSYNQALQIQKDHQQALEYQGELYVWRGQLLKANQNYKQLKRLNSPEAAELKERLDRVLAEALTSPALAALTDLLQAWIDEGHPVAAVVQDRGWLEVHDFEDYRLAIRQFSGGSR